MISRHAAIIYGLILLLYTTSIQAQQTLPLYAPADSRELMETIEHLRPQLERASVRLQVTNPGNFQGRGVQLTYTGATKAQRSYLKSAGKEAVAITANGKSVIIAGNSVAALSHGLFIYLEKLGFRFYFPHPDWYTIPSSVQLYPSFSYVGEPSFEHRRIWYGYGTGSPVADKNYALWFAANRLGSSLNAVIGHAYDDIVNRNKEAFLSHPEWFYPRPPKGTIPEDPKFDLANEELIQFITNDVLKRLEAAKRAGKPLQMISLCPSDGPGTCNTGACQKLGTISDRVYYLINRVAKVVRQKYPSTWISGMAYGEYSDAPTYKLEPNTFVSIATAFNPTKHSTTGLIREWSRKAGRVGMYDYLGLYVWDFDLPGKSQASQFQKVTTAVKEFHKLGAKGYDAETNPGSVINGLGHYVVARQLWDVKTNISSAREEFFNHSFGKSASMMQELWKEWQSYPYDLVTDSDLAEWIDLVDEAGEREKDAAVQRRLDHIRVYLHYLFLYNTYRKSNSDKDLVELLTYGYNTMDFGAISGYPALFVLGQKTSIEGLKFNDPNARYKKQVRSYSQLSQVSKLVAADRKSLVKKERLQAVALGTQFGKAPANKISASPANTKVRGTTAYMGPHNFIMELNTIGKANFLQLYGGMVEGGGVGRPITVNVYSYTGSDPGTATPLLTYEYTKVKDTQRISLEKLPKGVYLVTVDDPMKKFSLDFATPINYAVLADAQHRLNAYSLQLGFYVPRGTKKFRIFKQLELKLTSPTGRVIDDKDRNNRELEIMVNNGEEGVWIINFMSAGLHLEGIPGLVSSDPLRMLTPANYLK